MILIMLLTDFTTLKGTNIKGTAPLNKKRDLLQLKGRYVMRRQNRHWQTKPKVLTFGATIRFVMLL